MNREYKKNRLNPAAAGLAAILLTVVLTGCATPTQSIRAAGAPIATEVLAEWKRADRLYARGDLRKAQESYEMVLKRDPENNEVLFRLANIAYYLQDPTKARELYAKVYGTGLVDPQLFYNRAALNLTEGYNSLAEYRKEVGPGNVSPEIRAVMAAIERMSDRRPPVSDPRRADSAIGD
jgi:tetratricopeptide (TPR) repeat protein